MENIKLIVKSFKLDENGNVVIELASLETLKQNLINKLNNKLNNNETLDRYSKEIELLKIILENEKKD